MNCCRCLRAMIKLGIERGETVWHCVSCEITMKQFGYIGFMKTYTAEIYARKTAG